MTRNQSSTSRIVPHIAFIYLCMLVVQTNQSLAFADYAQKDADLAVALQSLTCPTGFYPVEDPYHLMESGVCEMTVVDGSASCPAFTTTYFVEESTGQLTCLFVDASEARTFGRYDPLASGRWP